MGKNGGVARKLSCSDLGFACDAVWEAVERENAALEGRGRVLVRPSGTEPLVRVMVEASESAIAERAAATIVDAVARDLGEPATPH